MIKAIIFDFDGVIVDSEPLHYRAFLETFSSEKVQFDYNTYVNQYIGFDDRDGFRAIADDFDVSLADDDILRLLHEKAQAFDRIVEQGIEAMPGAIQLIRQAASAMPIAIASGARQSDIDIILRGIENGTLTPLFKTIVTADDVEKSKPDPQTYLIAAEQIGVKPEECAVIEDTATGLQSAVAAGMKTIGVTHSYGPEHLNIADRVIHSLTDLDVNQVNKWFE